MVEKQAVIIGQVGHVRQVGRVGKAKLPPSCRSAG